MPFQVSLLPDFDNSQKVENGESLIGLQKMKFKVTPLFHVLIYDIGLGAVHVGIL